MSEVFRVLKSKGKIFSVMISNNSWGYGLGNELEKNTFVNIKKGPFANKGLVHFFEEKEIRKLLDKFENINIEVSTRTENN